MKQINHTKLNKVMMKLKEDIQDLNIPNDFRTEEHSKRSEVNVREILKSLLLIRDNLETNSLKF